MLVVGLISGTSADGIDAVLCDINGAPPNLTVKIVAGNTTPYPPELRKRIMTSYSPQESRIDEICKLNFDIGAVFAAAAEAIIKTAEANPQDVALVTSHGQTVWHEVSPNGEVHSTLQLGEAAVVAQRTGITTISSLRARDVAEGGQGAPLAGYVDWILLRHPEKWRAVQNIGGIGNVTFLPPLSTDAYEPLSFDNGPGNALMDDILRLSTDSQITYDANGEMARKGTVQQDWLDELMTHPYYERQPPKTTGRELFGAEMAVELMAEGQARNLPLEDVIATLTALTAHAIADSYQRFAPQTIEEIIIGGGGRHNSTMMDMLRELLTPAPVMTMEDIGYDSDYKEAMLCAVIGHETWHARTGNHPAITGARSHVLMGQISPGDNYVDLVKQTWAG